MKKLMFVLIIGLFLVSLVSSQQTSLGSFKQSSCIDLIQTCADCSYNNITSVMSPNSTQLLSNVAMTKQGSEFNYSFCSTDSIGIYNVNGIGDSEGTDSVWVYDFTVSHLGREQTTAQGINSAVFLIIVMVLTITFITLTFVFGRYPALWMLVMFSAGLSIFFMIYSLHLGYLYMLNLAAFESETIRILYYIISIFTVISVFVGLVFYFIKVVLMLGDDKKNKRNSDGWEDIIY